MLYLQELRKPKGAFHRRKRLGRGPGSGKGDTSGRGHKGQGARKSGNVRPGYEGGQTPLYRRIPKRGFRNIFSKNYITLNVSQLENLPFQEISLLELKENRLLKGKASCLKILGNGDLNKAIRVYAHKFTRSAKEKIEKAGGEAKKDTKTRSR